MDMPLDLNIQNGSQTDNSQRLDYIDFKMITFSLGGKDYGIDIMFVKEISRVNEFTYVPNAPYFIRGVYNLRGEIISVMDFRALFNTEIIHSKDGLEDLIVLQGEEHMTGAVVDSIDRVVGVSSSKIQPPHPLFAEINISFIKGIVEFEGRLFIILDVERILYSGKDLEEIIETDNDKVAFQPLISGMGIVSQLHEKENILGGQSKNSGYAQPLSNSEGKVLRSKDSILSFQTPPMNATDSIEKTVEKTQNHGEMGSLFSHSEILKGSVEKKQFLKNLAQKEEFFDSPVNKKWLDARFNEVSTMNVGTTEFLAPFFSRSTGELWSDTMMDEFFNLLPKNDDSTFYALNVGCAAGHESYSIAVSLQLKKSLSLVRIWAVDSDLMNISMAPTLAFDDKDIPFNFKPFIKEINGEKRIEENIVDRILFEYHDIMHDNLYPEMDLIVARDLLSFIPSVDQEKIIDKIVKKMKIGAVLFVGDNEEIFHSELILVENMFFTCYTKVLL